MRSKLILVLKCLVLIQFLGVTACKQSKGTSTKVHKGKNGKPTAQGFELGKAVSGKLSDNSYMNDASGKKESFKDQNCSFKVIKRGASNYISITMGKFPDEFPITDQVLEFHFKQMKKVTEVVPFKETRGNVKQFGNISTYADVQAKENGILVERVAYSFVKKSPPQDLAGEALVEINKNISDNADFADVNLFVDKYKFQIKEGQFVRLTYNLDKFKNGSGKGRNSDYSKDIKGEMSQEAELDCVITTPTKVAEGGTELDPTQEALRANPEQR